MQLKLKSIGMQKFSWRV